MYMYPLLRKRHFLKWCLSLNVEILVRAGDFKMTLNHKLDTTNKRSKSQLSRLVNISLTELGMFESGVE